jgi:ribonuclease P protein subunit RPR2
MFMREMSIIIGIFASRSRTYTNHRCPLGVLHLAQVRQASIDRALTRQKSNSDIRHIAEERIGILLNLAKDAAKTDPSLSERYVELAQRIAMRSGVRLGAQRKQFICKNCKRLLVPGVNCRVRVRTEHGTHVVVTCLACGSIKRYPAVKEKRLRRKR